MPGTASQLRWALIQTVTERRVERTPSTVRRRRRAATVALADGASGGAAGSWTDQNLPDWPGRAGTVLRARPGRAAGRDGVDRRRERDGQEFPAAPAGGARYADRRRGLVRGEPAQLLHEA